MSKKQYELVFRTTEDYVLPFHLKAFFDSDYLDTDYIFIYKKPEFEIYIEHKKQSRPAIIGLNLYSDKEKIRKLFDQERKVFKKIKTAHEIINKTNLTKLSNQEITQHLKELYKYFTQHLRVYKLTEVVYSKKVGSILKKYFLQKISNQDKHNRILAVLLNPSENQKIVEERQRLLSTTKISKKIKNLCSSARKIGKNKLIARDAYELIYVGLDLLLEEIAKRFYLSARQVKLLFFDEATDLLRGKKIPIDKINERTKLFVFEKNNNDAEFYIGKKAKQIISSIKTDVDINQKIIRGDIANPGKYQGKVVIMPIGVDTKHLKIIKQKIDKMEEGDILVAKTTGPEMIMACRKAGAIIAEEGGIISHAAIISRELNIPSIINTKIATEILRDGDLVEVNANKGIIKILKKTERK